MRSAPLVLALAVLGAALGAGPALAHLAFVRSDPAADATLDAPPAAVTLTFSGPADPTVSTGQVSVGGTVVSGPPTFSGAQMRLPIVDGRRGATYTVTYRVIDPSDRHPTEGTFTFSVAGAAAAPVPSPVPSPVPRMDSRPSPTPTPTPTPSPAPADGPPLALIGGLAALVVLGGVAWALTRRG